MFDFMGDVIAMSVIGRCYYQYYMEDVKPPHVFQLIATSVMADVIA